MPAKDFATEVARRVQRARRANGLSQADVAAALGISQAAVSNLEAGTRPLRVDELFLLGQLLGREVDHFLEPMRAEREPVGVTLRASVAGLAVPDLREAVNAFLDEIQDEALPDPALFVRARTPEKAAAELQQASGQTKPPINVALTAHKLGVGVFPWAFPDALSALILRHGENAIIAVNARQSSVRQRFSIAHELGHFVLHHDDQHFIEYGMPATGEGEPPGYDWRDERDANSFAAELLMPARLVRADAVAHSLPRLAHRYRVSQEAMSFRLANLGL